MSEENESSQSLSPVGADPRALGAALGRASPEVDTELKEYLPEQRHHMKAQFAPHLRQLHLGDGLDWTASNRPFAENRTFPRLLPPI